MVLFPLIDDRIIIESMMCEIGEDLEIAIVFRTPMAKNDYNPRTIEEVLGKELSKDMIDFIPKSYDIIGNIAIIEFNEYHSNTNQDLFKIKISEALMKVNKSVNTVFEKQSQIKNSYRLRDLKLLAGIDNAETTHKENHSKFKVNVKSTFFTPRLVFERKRIASYNFKPHEIIIDMFAGVGPFSIQIAKNNFVQIYSFDSNPEAIHYLRENLKLNTIQGEIIPYNINVRDLINPTNNIGKKLKGKTDRIIMNLPEKSLEYIDIASFLLKKEGIIHNYQFCEKPNSIENAIQNLRVSLNKVNRKVKKIISAKIVKAYSPKAELVVVDVYISNT